MSQPIAIKKGSHYFCYGTCQKMIRGQGFLDMGKSYCLSCYQKQIKNFFEKEQTK